MKKLKRSFTTKILLFVAFILLFSPKVLAVDISKHLQPAGYSNDFEKWLALSVDEKKNVMQPRMYDITYIESSSSNPFFRALSAYSDSYYSLKDVIPANLAIKNQMQTNSCWTFAALSSLETNLAMADYKKGATPKIYDYSERHMEYATSKYFANGATNSLGYSRAVGDGGQWYNAFSYLTNGQGAILESEMPFQDNETLININELQNKTVATQVQDTIDFPDYLAEANIANAETIKTQIKQHIQNYGAVFASIHGNSSTASFSCYNNSTSAKYCNVEEGHPSNHAVSIIGWDDNFAIDNFPSNARPANKGAWIVRNSWGTSFGDAGLMYVSYEDFNISKTLFGIVKASDNVDYENIYQYDEYFPAYTIALDNSKFFLGTVFSKKTSGKEYLTQVSLYAPETYTCKVYVNPNGSDKAKSNLQAVTLKAGEYETVSAGYHTLEFATPVAINASNFVVVVEVQTSTTSPKVVLETQVPTVPAFDNVKVETNKCFLTIENPATNEFINWLDLGLLSETDSVSVNGDSTIKAFTVSEVPDSSIKNIEIVNSPTKTTYYEGENFNSAGMVVKANYNDGSSRTLANTDYSITNGTNLTVDQIFVTISYDGKTVQQPISVVAKSITNITVIQNPTKLTYIQSKENLSLDGGKILATYNDGSTNTIDMTSQGVVVSGFDNSTLGNVIITVSYQNKTTSFTVTIIEDPNSNPDTDPDDNPSENPDDNPSENPDDNPSENPDDNPSENPDDNPSENPDDNPSTNPDEKVEAKNSNFDNTSISVKRVQAYYFTNNSKNNYILVQLTMNGINRALTNDTVEYYYYLSPSINEQSIDNWVKVSENQSSSNQLQFEIDSRKITNLADIIDDDTVYLYLKEVAIKGGDQCVAYSKPLRIDSNITAEIYVDGVRKQQTSTVPDSKQDGTTAPGKIPQTGVKFPLILSIIAIVGIGFGIILYVRYKKLVNKMK